MKSPVVTWILEGATLLTLAGGLWWLAAKSEKDKTVQFSSPEMKVQTEYLVQSADPVDVLKKKFRDSLAEAKFRKTQDSMDLARDQLTKANATDVYNLRKDLDTLKTLLEHALDHIE